MDARGETPDIGRGVLQAIFAVFLGLMITAVVGVGVYTFHPNPSEGNDERVNELSAERSQIECPKSTLGQCRTPEQLTAAERARIAAIDTQTTALQQESQQRGEAWRQSTSVILIVIATVLMAVSLALGATLAVLSNGILLGGLFTMLYGVGWGLASGNSVTRFVVLLAALAVSLGLGWLKFVRGRRPTPAGAGAGAGAPAGVPGAVAGEVPSAALAELSGRVADLEERLAASAALLLGSPAGDRSPESGPPRTGPPRTGPGATRRRPPAEALSARRTGGGRTGRGCARVARR